MLKKEHPYLVVFDTVGDAIKAFLIGEVEKESKSRVKVRVHSSLQGCC